MTTPTATNAVKERLARCPACQSDVLADVYAVRFRGDWYHLRCAIGRHERERAAQIGAGSKGTLKPASAARRT